MNEFDVAHGSSGEARACRAQSQDQARERSSVKYVREGGVCYHPFSKALHISSNGSEDNIEPFTMERDPKDFINGLSEEKFVTSDPVCSI